MKRSLLLAALFTSVHWTVAQVATDPIGVTAASQLSNSDTLISIPVTRAPEFTVRIDSVSGGVITVQGTPGWTPNQFVYAAGVQPKHYYVLMGPVSSAGTSNSATSPAQTANKAKAKRRQGIVGATNPTNPKEGHVYSVTGNTQNTLTVDTTEDNLTGIPAGTEATLIPNWTLNTLFPATDQNVSFTPTTQTRSFKTEILIPNYSAPGVNQAFSTVYFFSNNVNGTTNNVGWRVVGDNTTDHGDDPLLSRGYFVVRNLNSAPTMSLTALGSVLTKKFAVPLATQAGAAQDNSVSMIRPVAVKLNDTGLNPTDGSFVATTDTRSFKDELLLFNNATTALNKSPSAIYFYSNNVNGTTNNIGWRVLGDNTTDHGNDLIPVGSAIIIRKAANGTGGNVFWTNSPTY